MSPAGTSALKISLVAAGLLLLVGCATTTTTPMASRPEPRVPEDSAGEPDKEIKTTAPALSEPMPGKTAQENLASRPEDAIDRAEESVVALLSAQLRIPRESIRVLQVARAEWPDMCLGLAAEGEICGLMITPGYAVSLAAGEQRFDFRTDESGQRIRLASAPKMEPGKPLVTWRDARSFSMLVVGTQRVAFGRRGRPLLVAPLGIPERATELQKMLARFAPFQARTVAGDIALAGVGTVKATPTDQRMVAEWAKLVSTESEKGLAERAPDRAIVWRRQGGQAGFCDLAIIGRAGTATAYSCRGGSEREIVRIDLSPEEISALYTWLDQDEAFSWRTEEGASAADGMTVSMEFDGDGVAPASETDRDEILAFVNRIVRRLFTARAGS